MGDDHSDRPAGGDERDIEAAARAEASGRFLVDLGIVEERVDPLGPAPLQHAAALRPYSLELHADSLTGAVAVGCLDPQRPVAGGQRDRHQPCPDQSAQAAGDQLEQPRELDLARERRPHLVQRLELLRPRRCRLVEPRVLDRDRGLARERADELLVLGRERSGLLLGQVEVAEGAAAEQDRHAQEAAHRWMVGREADRARVIGDRLQSQRARVGDQGAEDAAAARKVADLGHLLGVDAGVDEALEPRSRRVDHAERGVTGAGQGGGRLGQLLQQIVQREL